jgi:hypothetical protein
MRRSNRDGEAGNKACCGPEHDRIPDKNQRRLSMAGNSFAANGRSGAPASSPWSLNQRLQKARVIKHRHVH